MRVLNETFEDKEHKALLQRKEHLELSWHDFILLLSKIELEILQELVKDQKVNE